MIIDKLKNAKLYYGLDRRIRKALEFLESSDPDILEEGRYEIDADNIFAKVSEYSPKSKDSSRWEAHKKYIDIQYVVKGREFIGYNNIDSMLGKTEYDDQKDISFFSGDGNFVKLEKGMFGIYFPEDVHMPAISCDAEGRVKKVVIKVKTD
ncbi:MAG: YhcH/YjgK/YiaL family protein [Clostridiaceae bacterium]|nr:YhcH/YjgK/YiaL family protein [Clostridiaceae bacterium]